VYCVRVAEGWKQVAGCSCCWARENEVYKREYRIQSVNIFLMRGVVLGIDGSYK